MHFVYQVTLHSTFAKVKYIKDIRTPEAMSGDSRTTEVTTVDISLDKFPQLAAYHSSCESLERLIEGTYLAFQSNIKTAHIDFQHTPDISGVPTTTTRSSMDPSTTKLKPSSTSGPRKKAIGLKCQRQAHPIRAITLFCRVCCLI